MSRWSVVVALVAMGCGDNSAAPESDQPAVALEGVPVSLAPGDSLGFHVEVSSDAEVERLVVGLQEPGLPAPPDGPRFSQPGIAPATGSIWYLTAAGTWGTDAVTLDPKSVDVATLPPAPALGEWRVFAGLTSDLGDAVAADERALIVTDKLALRVSVDKRWVDAKSPVQVTARVAPADRAATAKLVAWLTLPDGTQLALPTLTPELIANAVGAYGEETTLLHRDLEVYGPGNYRVAVRLVDPDSGELLAAGGAGFTLCSARAAVTGSVGGVDLASASVANVLLHPIDGDAIVSVPIDASGAFHADLPAGRWIATGVVADSAGLHELPETPFVAGCEAPVQLALDAGPAVEGHVTSVPTPRVLAQTAQSAPAPDPVLVYVMPESAVGTDAMRVRRAKTLAELFLSQVTSNAAPGVEFFSDKQLTMVANGLVTRMRLGVDTIQDSRALARFGNAEFALTYRHHGEAPSTIESFGMKYYKYPSPFALWDELQADRYPIASQIISDIGTRMGHYKGDASRTLAEWLIPSRDPIRQPSVMFIPPPPPAPLPSTAFELAARAFDARTGQVAPIGTRIKFVVSSTQATIAATVGDEAGTARATLSSGINGRTETFTALFQSGTRTGRDTELIVTHAPRGQDDVVSAQPSVTSRREVGITVTQALLMQHASGAPVAPPQLVVTRGTLTGPSEVVFDAHHEFHTTFKAGDEPGLAVLAVRDPMTNQTLGTGYVAVDAPLELTLSVSPQPNLLIGTSVTVLARVDLTSTGTVAPSVPVRFEVLEPGASVSPASTTTSDAGFAQTTFSAGTMAGHYHVRASAQLDGVTVQRAIELVVREPCIGCPIVITGPTSVDKGATISFVANQLVTWSATGGTIDSAGNFTAGNAGGVFTITATSTENAGSTGTKDVIVACDASDMVGTYMGPQNLVVDPMHGCGTSGMTIGMITIAAHPNGNSKNVDITYQWTSMCGTSWGVGAIQFLPTITTPGCTVSSSTNVGGCQTGSISLSATGPGVHGISGGYTRELFMNGSCAPAEDGTFDMVKQ